MQPCRGSSMVKEKTIRMACLLSVLLTPAWMGCSSAEQPALVLDELCGSPLLVPDTDESGPCRVSGDAQMASGLLSNLVAYRLGSGTGALHIQMGAMLSHVGGATWSMDVLVRSLRPEGSTLYRTLTWADCLLCPPDPPDAEGKVTESASWMRAVDGVAGLDGKFENLADTAELTLRGADIALIDVRFAP